VDCTADETEQLMSDIQASLSQAGIDVVTEFWEVPVGRIAKAIIEAAEEHDVRYIVLGSSRNTDLPLLSVGSVSLRVLHHCRRPVMVVPRRADAKAMGQTATAATAG
jgi:nucleotide-binding universal stress UspA family protein